MTINDDPGIDRLLPYVDAVKQYVDLSRATAYRLIQAGHVRVVKVGSRTMIRRSELNRLIDSFDTSEAA